MFHINTPTKAQEQSKIYLSLCHNSVQQRLGFIEKITALSCVAWSRLWLFSFLHMLWKQTLILLSVSIIIKLEADAMPGC